MAPQAGDIGSTVCPLVWGGGHNSQGRITFPILLTCLEGGRISNSGSGHWTLQSDKWKMSWWGVLFGGECENTGKFGFGLSCEMQEGPTALLIHPTGGGGAVVSGCLPPGASSWRSFVFFSNTLSRPSFSIWMHDFQGIFFKHKNFFQCFAPDFCLHQGWCSPPSWS